jgi:hypothetical protein
MEKYICKENLFSYQSAINNYLFFKAEENLEEKIYLRNLIIKFPTFRNP